MQRLLRSQVVILPSLLRESVELVVLSVTFVHIFDAGSHQQATLETRRITKSQWSLRKNVAVRRCSTIAQSTDILNDMPSLPATSVRSNIGMPARFVRAVATDMLHLSDRCRREVGATTTSAGFKCVACATAVPIARPTTRSSLTTETPTTVKRRSTSVIGDGRGLFDSEPTVIGATSSTVTTRSTAATTAELARSDPMSAFSNGDQPLLDRVARLPPDQRASAEAVLLGATQPLTNPNSVMLERLQRMREQPAPDVPLLDLDVFETELDEFRKINTKNQIFKLADKNAKRDGRDPVLLEDFLIVCEKFEEFTEVCRKHLPNMWGVLMLVVNGARNGSTETEERQMTRCVQLMAHMLLQVSREFNTLPMLFSLYLQSINVPSGAYRALQSMSCGFVSRKTLVRMLVASSDAMAARLLRGIVKLMRYHIYWDNIDYQLLQQRTTGNHIQWCIVFFVPHTLGPAVSGDPLAPLVMRDALALAHLMPDSSRAIAACSDVLRCMLARASNVAFVSSETEVSAIAVRAHTIIGLPMIEKAQTKNEDAADVLRTAMEKLPNDGSRVAVFGDQLSDARGWSASLLGDRNLRRMMPMVALWHTNNRGNLPGLLKLLGAHLPLMVTATHHTRAAELSAASDQPNAKQSDRLLRIIVLELLTRAVIAYRTSHARCTDAEAVDGVINDLFDVTIDEKLRAAGEWSKLRARTFVTLFILAYQELDSAVANAQSARMLRALRWSLVLLHGTSHALYAHSVMRMLINLTAVVGRADAAAFIAGHFVDTGSRRFVASDCFVELMIARIKAMMGAPTRVFNSQYLKSISASVVLLDELRHKCHELFHGSSERRGYNDGSPEHIDGMRQTVRQYLQSTNLRVLSTDSELVSTKPGAVVDTESNVLLLNEMYEKTAVWATDQLSQFRRGEPEELFVSRGTSRAIRARNAAAMGDDDDDEDDDDDDDKDDDDKVMRGDALVVGDDDGKKDDDDEKDDDNGDEQLVQQQQHVSDLIPVAIHSFRESGHVLAFDR